MSGPAEPIYIWPVRLGDPTPWERLLAADELQRGRQRRRAEDRAAYLACRGVLRAILGRFLGRDPTSLRFVYGTHEKPFLDDGACAFNVSRSNRLALIAIARSGRLGIDVERIRPDVDVEALASAFLAPGDAALLTGLPQAERIRTFFRLWVRHEARVKATGRGLVVPAEDEATATHDDGLWMRDFEIGPDFAAALAADGPEDRRVVLHAPAPDADLWPIAAPGPHDASLAPDPATHHSPGLTQESRRLPR